MTADFTRWSRNCREGVLAASTAFPVASMVAQLTGGVVVAAGAISAPATNGGNFLPLLADGAGPLLSALAIVFVFVNLGSVCSHCLYNGAVSWSHILGGRMRVLTLLLGLVGVAVALAGVWSHFLSWLVILSVFVPPIGAVLIADQVLLRGAAESRVVGAVRPTAFAAWAIGAGFAALVHYEAPQWSDAVVGLVTGAVAYLAIEAVAAQSRAAERRTTVTGVPEPAGAE
jgi:cytosine permease